ncbi:MAG: hypothetical protein AAB785_00845, partial [Patescibacteria group bacterium]
AKPRLWAGLMAVQSVVLVFMQPIIYHFGGDVKLVKDSYLVVCFEHTVAAKKFYQPLTNYLRYVIL